ncbi:E3 ubiquitin-protein ligase synoviolin-like [Ornithodoros turicata]|uniref:E3 ubiquitin-protein ligase synoviolin-like n=1 Tax=Ornithodoros turicata TaxID=34597 RepID=UPI003138D1B9
MRAFLLTLGSVVMTTAVIGNAYYQKKQFYPSVVYLTKSNPSMAIIYLQAFVMVILVGKLMRKVFFGQLRAAEMEHLIERSWYAVTETCLAFTVFRDDFSPKFVALFTLLLFLKCFHWLAEDRVDYMERSPIISYLFHMRVIALLLLLGLVDYLFVAHAYHSTLLRGASVQVVFGFEYAILLSIVVNIYFKYFLHTIDLHSENPWENKAVYLLYTELVMSFIKVVLYLTFMAIMIKIHTFPLFAIRPMYLSMRAFKKAFNDTIMSRRAIRNMNTLYPDATPEELASADNVCIICREEMVGGGNKRLPCSHIFHTACLRSWFQRQQTCPTCRMDVLRGTPPQPHVPPAQPAAQPQQAAPHQPQAPPAFPQWPGMPAFPMMQQLQQMMQQQPLGVRPQHGQQPAAAAAAAAAQPPPSTPQPQPGPSTSGAVPPTSSAGAGTSSTTTPGATLPNFAATGPFFIPPFFAFMLPPPPVAPEGALDAMTREELLALEGQERERVTARIRCLRNIQTLLDAAVMQLQQYNTIVTRETWNVGHAAAQASGKGAAAAASETSEGTSVRGAAGGAAQEERQDPGGVSATAESEDFDSSDPNAEVRRRRLERFSHSTISNGKPSDPNATTGQNVRP